MHTVKITNFFKKKNYLLYFLALAIFFFLYTLIINQIKSHIKLKENNFNLFLKSNEFNDVKQYVLEKSF